VAIIAHRDDLGAVTALWRRPQVYAHFLGVELSLGYKGELLVVMPNGFGLNWPGHSTANASTALSQIPIGPGGTGMVAAAVRAAQALDGRLGINLMPGAAGSHPGSGPAHKRPAIPTITAGPAPVRQAASSARGGSSDAAIRSGSLRCSRWPFSARYSGERDAGVSLSDPLPRRAADCADCRAAACV
jgi:hypothetical protein